MTQTVIPNGVILAENDSLMRNVIRSTLVRAGQRVFPAGDGVEAVMLAKQFKARLVLLDIAMPRLDGLRACEAMRGLPDYADVPIVMISGYADRNLPMTARKLGANELIRKPFAPSVLLARLSAYLDIPTELVPALPHSDQDRDAVLRQRGISWGPPGGFTAGPTRSQPLETGYETMQIYRNAERKG